MVWAAAVVVVVVAATISKSPNVGVLDRDAVALVVARPRKDAIFLVSEERFALLVFF